MRRMPQLHKLFCGAVAAGVLCTPLANAREPVLKDALPTVAVEATRSSSDVEIIRERHPNRTVKIEREVIRDADDNYVNHGTWKMWDKEGRLVANGRYRDGERQGDWTAWFLKHETKLFFQAPFKQFESPFVSKATFEEGKIQGVWSIHDNKDRKVAEWSYQNGERHGTWTTWYPNGQTQRQLEFNQGDLQGEATTWAADGKVVGKETFETGRRLLNRVEYFAKNQKKSEGVYLLAKQELTGEDDWWNAKLAAVKAVGKDERHGAYKEWYRNGQLRGQGTYENDQPHGLFTWWFDNGQRSVEGRFETGRKVNRWTWWHSNGQKSINGEYETGAPEGNWIWWNAEGKVAQRIQYSAPSTEIEPTLDEEITPEEAIVEAVQETPAKPKTRVAEQPSGVRIR